MAPIPSLRELDSMTEEQRYALLKESTAALVHNFKNVEARVMFALLNDQTVRESLAWEGD